MKPASNSLKLASLPAPQYDFYYSAKQADRYEQIKQASYTQEDQVKQNCFRDKIYTEMVPKGLKASAVYSRGHTRRKLAH